MTTGSSVEVRDLCVDYPFAKPLFYAKTHKRHLALPRKRRYRALHDVTFSVEPGERVGVIGMNGAGKSTLFRSVAGILNPSEGTIDVAGNRATSPLRLPVGYMAAYPLLYRRLTGYENLRYVANLYHIPNFDERIETLAERVGIFDALPMYVEQYSTGMAARLDLARALLPNPPLLLLDEPFGSFDVRFAEEARKIILGSKATVLLATHNLTDIEKLTGRILLLHEGHLVRDVFFDDLSEVTPGYIGKDGKALSIVEFVEILLRRSIRQDNLYPQPLHRRHVVPT